MKKFLSFLVAFAIIVIVSASFTACNDREAENNDDSADTENTILVTEDDTSKDVEKESGDTTKPHETYENDRDSEKTDESVFWSENY